MKSIDKIKLLEEILGDKDTVSKKILKEEEPEGKLIVAAEGDSPAEAKETMLKNLEGIDLPDEEDMEEVMPEMDEESMMEDEEEELDEDMLEDEDREILDVLPEASREEFKKKLMEKIKSL
jgi:hypothetical protein